MPTQMKSGPSRWCIVQKTHRIEKKCAAPFVFPDICIAATVRHLQYQLKAGRCAAEAGARCEGYEMLENKVKLLIWDLDDTFWSGTLTEGGITPIPRNGELVVELSKRGIINSICSKNDHDAAKAKLIELGVWDYFVFPTISFSPKGQAVAEMIEG